jgi:hypothetical protein
MNNKINLITDIDILNLGINFKFIYKQNSTDIDKIIFNNQYEFIYNLADLDWKISRWILINKDLFIEGEFNIENKFKINFDDWNIDKKRIFLLKYNKNYYLSIFFKKNYIIIKIDPMTYLPIVNKKLIIIQLLKFYQSDINLINDLMPLIYKYNLENFYLNQNNKLSAEGINKESKKEKMSIYHTTYEHIYNYIDNNNKNINQIEKYKSDNNILCLNKQNYKLKYKKYLINIPTELDKYEKLYYENFYQNKREIKSFTDYMIFSLSSDEEIINIDNTKIQLKNFTFSLFYTKLIKKIFDENKITDYNLDNQENIKILNDKEIIILKPDDEQNTFTINPLEFLYQYIFGFFARDEQLKLADNIFTDIRFP